MVGGRTNTYPDCQCEPWRYSPMHPKPTNPSCETHGDNMCDLQTHIERDIRAREQETAETAETNEND